MNPFGTIVAGIWIFNIARVTVIRAFLIHSSPKLSSINSKSQVQSSVLATILKLGYSLSVHPGKVETNRLLLELGE